MFTPNTYHKSWNVQRHQDATRRLENKAKCTMPSKHKFAGCFWQSASKDSLGVTHISLVNIDAHKAQQITIDTKGLNYKSITGRILTFKTLGFQLLENPNKLETSDA